MDTASLLAQITSATPTLETPTSVILKTGIFGAIIVTLAGVVVYLWRDSKAEIAKRDEEMRKLQADQLKSLADLQALRVADVQAFASQQLRTNEQTVAALTNVVNAMEAHREAMNELKEAFKELGEEFRKSSISIRRG